MKAELLSLDRITVLDFVERPLNKVADDRDRQSIEKNGIQQPLVVVAEGDRLLLAKGLRRLRIARALGISKVPVVIESLPRGYDAETYVRELRLALDMHRQDLLPSQKCGLLEELKGRFGMTHKQLAVFLGIDADSVTNWLAVKHYIAPVIAALDAGRLTMQAARVFDGMTEAGQRTVWKRHGRELERSARGELHRVLRRRYDPRTRPEFYRDPGLVTQRLGRKQRRGAASSSAAVTANEKRRLGASLELKEIELREGVEEERKLKGQIQAAIAPLAAIRRNGRLAQLIPQEMWEELDRFAEVYI